ncbi:hypothetical protein OH710_22465 [Pseudomonas capsici]|uniref:hypothetical protein n=1 Tax=Pseudomonas capsici TaxID=2810614 RepID=UPI0021F20FA2|nr:hypothetical protein [Pseudomonas capsici]MCV4275413.1 hypothetical protein [Pseudomonas capsici]
MNQGNIWREDILPLVKQLISWIVGKPSKTLIMVGIMLVIPGTTELIIALLSQVFQAHLGHPPSTTSANDVGYSQITGGVLLLIGVAMTLYEWWLPHSDRRNQNKTSAAAARLQDQKNLRNSYKTDSTADLQTNFQQAWGPVDADPQQIFNVLDYKADPGKAVRRFIKGMALVKTESNWFALKHKWIPAAFWIYFSFCILSLVVSALNLVIIAAHFAPGMPALSPEKEWTLAVLGITGVLTLITFKSFLDLMFEFGSAVNLCKMPPP